MKRIAVKSLWRRTFFSMIAGLKVTLQNKVCRNHTSMSIDMKSSKKLGLFMTDFDNTCNKRDTTELFYKASQAYQYGANEERLALDAKWEKVQRAYLQSYNKLIEETLERYANSKTTNLFDEEGLLSFLKVIADFNTVSTEDVDDSQLVNGADETGLKLVAKQVAFYPGCIELLRIILPHVRVVSVNWSAEFIGYSFNSFIPKRHIYANHLLDENGLSNGIVGKNMISSFDKRKVMQMLVAKKEFSGLNLFVGDSITDLLCLIDADFGIIIGNSSTLLRAASIFGINVIPLSEYVHKIDLGEQTLTEGNSFPSLLKAASWFEIEELVKKLV